MISKMRLYSKMNYQLGYIVVIIIFIQSNFLNCLKIEGKKLAKSNIKIIDYDTKYDENEGIIFDISKMSLTDTYRLDAYLHDFIEKKNNLNQKLQSINEKKLLKKQSRDAQ